MPEGSSDLIADPSNTNRTTLKILNDKYQDPIKAKVEYNKTTGLIETTVTYSKYGINKITFEDTTELQMTNTNGIITANTEGIVLAGGKNKITITDNKGNKKNIKVTVPLEYGRKVFGYECDTEGVEWRLFHADDNNIYLIADDYIPYESIPTSTNGTALNKGSYSTSAYFTNILNDYTGSSWIKKNTNPKAQKWLSKYLVSYPESTNENMKAVAYMMDTDSWSKFAGDKAEYAIGGPTVELFCASYKQTHPSRYIECDNINENGYQVKWSDGSYASSINGLTQDDYGSIYIKSDSTKAVGMWLTSPSANGTNYVMRAHCDCHFGYNDYNITYLGFRPVVCLKSDVKLVDNGDNTYSIKETITAKAEYNKDTNQIEVRIAYSDNPISKIMLNDTNELSMTNTNGIIANTAGISLEDGTYTITVTDNKGNKKELTVKVKIPPIRYYGKEVTNYTCSAPGVDKWRVFHVDENNIYLIADDYVPYANLPTSTAGTALNKYSDYKAYFTNILSNYTGSSWIRSNTNAQARKWLTWVNSYPSSTNNNIKAVAYMMDTNKWSTFAGEKAEYAIGGPTLELFCASYEVTHPDRYIECNSTNANGYQARWSNGSYTTNISGLTQDDYNSIYIKSDRTKADGMWIASPCSSGSSNIMRADYNCYVGSTANSYYNLGFRPLVCLKSGVELVDNGDGTCRIKEAITAVGEYNKETDRIEIRVIYSDNEISKIIFNDTTELPITNTNGIITANTAGITLEDGTYTVTITDNEGNIKNLTIPVLVYYGEKYYGKEVTNYTCSASGVDKWRIFYADDDNVYLIADDYVPYANLPTSRRGTALNKISDYRADFSTILSDYTGSAWIKTNTNEQAQKWISKYLTAYPSSTNENIKAVAYMMDTNKWSGFAGDKAEYAIGGPTIEMFCASYKVTHPNKYIECDNVSSNGYKLKFNTASSYSYYVNGLSRSEYNSIYLRDRGDALGMWIASPSDYANVVMYGIFYGTITGSSSDTSSIGFRPVVCLKSGVRLKDNGNGTYSIK